jgi:ABC-type transport system involved in multi-copper enzyme maturation permease subunit
MLGRTFAIAMNTYREAVRARILFGLLALALGTSAYSLVIAAMSIRGEMRIVADLGASSISLYAVLVAIVLGATSLYRELELKTVFPILTRKLRRHEYVVGKYLGIVATLFVFVAIDGAFVLAILGIQSKQHVALTGGIAAGMLVTLGVLLWRAKRARVFVVLPWAVAFFAAMALLAKGAGLERQLVVVSCGLALAEIAIIAALAMLFSAFSSPFLTAIFTLMVFLIGRSSETLGNLPEHLFGSTLRAVGLALSKVVPNLGIYVPARPLLLGEIAGVGPYVYLARAWGNALCYAAVLLAISALIFRKRDFQ